MNISGSTLKIVIEAFESHASDLRNMIVTCPDAKFYAKELAEYDHELVKIGRLKARAEKEYAKYCQSHGVNFKKGPK